MAFHGMMEMAARWRGGGDERMVIWPDRLRRAGLKHESGLRMWMIAVICILM